MSTTAPSPRPSPTDSVSYADLYARWEKGNWSATELDFSVDRTHWLERFDEHRRKAALFNYSLFFWGEDAVADNLSPFIDAAPTVEQKYFLTTQQVDEARHAVFFKRFMHEVVGKGDGTMAGGLEAIRPELTWGFVKVFDRLDRMADELRRDRSREQLARAVTLYHVVIEATLAQAGQHFIAGYLEREDLMPGFREGIANVAFDEQRHIGFGVKLLADLVREDPGVKDGMMDLLGEVLPWTLSVFVPPGWDESYITTFGMSMAELAAEGLGSLDAKLKVIGFDPDEIQRVVPEPMELPTVERSRRSLEMVRAGYFGEKQPRAARDPEKMALLFDAIRLSVDHRHAPSAPRTIQWDFHDAEPWYLHVANGDTHVAHGRAPKADLTLRCSFDDWVDVIAGREDARKLVLRRRIRPRGNPLVLREMQKFLPGRNAGRLVSLRRR